MAIVSDVEIRLRADIARLQSDLTRARQQVSGFTSSVKSMVGGLFAGLGAGMLVTQVAGAQREFEKLRASLITVTGSSKEAGKAFEAIQKFAAATPFSVQEVTEGFLKLRNLGLTPSERALESYGNTAAAMGKNLNQMIEAVADAATGEFERLKEFGIKAKQNGDQVALTFQGVTKTIGNNAADIESYLMAIGEVEFAGGMSRQADTLDGDLSNLNDTWRTTLVAFSQGSGFGDLLRGSIQALSASLSDLGAMFKAIGGAAEDEGKKVEAITPLHKFLTTVFEALTVVGVNVAYVFKTIGKDIGAFAAQAVTLFNGGFSGMLDGSTVKALKDISNARSEDAKRARAEVDATSERILGAAAKNQAARAKDEADRKAKVEGILGGYKIQGEAVKKVSDAEKKAAAEATKDAAKRLQAYNDLQAALRQNVEESAREAAGMAPLNEAQKYNLDLTAKLAAGKLKLTGEQIAATRANIAEWESNIAETESKAALVKMNEELYEIHKAVADTRANAIEQATTEADSSERLVETFGMTAAAIAQMEVARLKEQLAQRSSVGMTLDEIEHLEQLIALKERSTQAKGALDLQELMDPTKAETFGDALRTAFGAASDSMGKLIGALDTYGTKQAAIDKARKLAATTYRKDSKEYATVSAAITQMEVRDRVSAYGDMAGAAKDFFSEGSKGYAVLETAEKAFRAYELALALQTMTKKIFFKEAEVVANTTLNATKLAGEATTTGASVALAGTEASAWGVTAVVKAIASLPFPLNLAAGAATLAAVVAIGAKVMGGMGGGGVSLSESRQKSQGTGTVMGNTDAKSESIAKSMAMIEDNTYQGLTVSMGMLNALTEIKNNLGSFAALVVRDSVAGPTGGTGYDSLARLSGVFDGAGGGLSKIAAKISNAIFGGKKTLEDTGFTIGKTTMEAIANGGLNAMKYADIKKDGGLFRSDKFSTETAGIGDEGNRRIAALLASLADGVKAAGAALGLPVDDFTAKLNNFVVDIGKISFKDMKPDEVEAAVQAVFSKLGDQMAQFAVGGLEPFQKAGEGYLETLTRVAQGYQTVDVVMQSMNMTFSAVGFGSIAARERLIELSGGLQDFVQNSESFLKDFFTETEQADALKARVEPMLAQYGLQAAGEGATRALRDYVVALDTTTEEGARAYATLLQLAPAIKQIADAEQYIYDQRKDLQDQLDAMTMTAGQLRAKERDAVHESNRALFDQVAALQDAEAAAEELARAQREQADAAREAAEAAQQALENNEATLRGFVDSALAAVGRAVNAQKNIVTAAYQDAMASLDKHIARVNGTIERTGELSKLLAGSYISSPGDAVGGASSQAARAQITAALAIAKSSGVLPSADDLRDALSTLGRDNSDEFTSMVDYQRSIARTNAEIEQLGGLSDGQLDTAQRQLKVLEDRKTQAGEAHLAELQRLDEMVLWAQAQVDATNGVDNSVMGVAQAMAGMRVALEGLRTGATPTNPTGGNLSVEALYRTVLGREGEAAGVAYWKNVFGATVDSREYAEFVKGAVPELELQRRAAPPVVESNIQSGTMGGSSAMVSELQTLNNRMATMETAMTTTASATGQLAREFSNVSAGGNALLTEPAL